MSRLAQSKAAPMVSRAGGGDINVQDDVCPVCKSSKYLNKKLEFLVNPECYHKMCESCVDRIFSHGPAPCPIPGCHKTLRKMRFRKITFEDLQVEREVDIRRRIAAVFNKREDDFEDLRAYNDYLNEVEDITFNLVNGIDVDETNARLDTYQHAHADEIAENANQGEASYETLRKQEREQARLRRETARREDEEERRETALNRQDILNRLASGSEDAEKVAMQGQQVQLKRRMDRQAAVERQRQLQTVPEVRPGGRGANGSSNVVIKGLKARKAPAPEAPIDPFGGLSLEGRQYYTLQPEYVWDTLRDIKKEVRVMTGGYSVSEFTGRALCEAFSGLGVFIADEVTEQDHAMQDPAVEGTKRVAIAAEDVKMEDQF